MKILVTFKVIPDLDQMSAGDYCADERMMVDTSFVRTILNCFDESGLEFGLRLSDEAESLNLVVETTALTVAEKQAELYLKTLAALKYSHTVCVNAEGRDLRFEPESVAESVYRYCKEHPQDYIIMGNQAAPGNNCLTPKILAEKLGHAPEIARRRGWTDAGVLSTYGKIPTVVLGPGDLSFSHAVDERIPVCDLVEFVDIYANIAAEFCR